MNETAPQHVAVETALVAFAAVGVDEALGLVEAQRRRRDAGALAQGPDREGLLHASTVPEKSLDFK